MRTPPPPCTFDGCELAAHAKSLCRSHRAQQKAGKTLQPLQEDRKKKVVCHTSGCTTANYFGGYCQEHFADRYIDPLRDGRKAPISRSGPCTRPDCQKPRHSRGLCLVHYDQYRLGRPFTELETPENAERLFWERIISRTKVDAETGCHEWTDTLARGYGSISRDSKAHLVHRLVWERIHGKLPPRMQVHHKCANRKCSAPDHLELTTSRENVAEMFERNYYIKRIADLEAEVAELRALLGDAAA